MTFPKIVKINSFIGETKMRNPVLIGATVMGAVLLATLPVSVKWSAEKDRKSVV